jgi:AcrR family transcriptional regulator
LSEQVGRLPVVDPLSSLHPTAARILLAAQRVVMREGMGGFTLQKVAQEAEVQTSLIAYHFGGRSGLITALIDSISHDRNIDGMVALSTVPDVFKRAEQLVGRQNDFANDVEYMRLFFSVVPALFQDEETRQNAASLWQWWFELMLRDLGVWEDEELREKVKPLGALLVAMLGGLALQKVIDPECDLRPRFQMWSRMVQTELKRILTDTTPSMTDVPAVTDE